MAVKAAQVTVDTSADKLAESDIGGQQVIVRNAVGAAVFLGGTNAVTAGTGFELPVGGMIDIILGQHEELWAICATSTRVDVLRFSAD